MIRSLYFPPAIWPKAISGQTRSPPGWPAGISAADVSCMAVDTTNSVSTVKNIRTCRNVVNRLRSGSPDGTPSAEGRTDDPVAAGHDRGAGVGAGADVGIVADGRGGRAGRLDRAEHHRVHLHASLAGLGWTVNAYVLSLAVLLMTGAALG